MSKTFAITPVYDLLLRGNQDMPIGICHLHLATIEQLTRLHYSTEKMGMLKTVNKRLKHLTDNGYIQADSIPTKRFKSPYYYAPDTKGYRYLAGIGLDTDSNFRSSKEVSENYLHLRHALELNDVLIAALRLKYTHPNYYLARYLHERVLKRNPFKVNGITLIPDGFIEIKQRTTNKSFALLIELDRGTEQQEHFRRRIRAYKDFLSSQAYVSSLQTNHVLVAFTTFVGAKRVQQMREWTKLELANEVSLQHLLIFSDLPKPLAPHNLLFERRWYTLASDQPIALLEG